MGRTRTIMLLFFALSSLFLKAEIRGIVIDGEDNEPLVGVRIEVCASDSILQKAFTDDKGGFILPISEPMDITLLFYLASYNELSILIKYDGESVDIGMIPLRPAMANLNEVSISAKGRLSTTVDHYIVLPTDKDIALSANIFDFLAALKVPNMAVNKNQNEVTINNLPVEYQINGVKCDKNRIFSINIRDIKKVDVFTTPPIAYDNKDIGGIVNIIVNRSQRGGYSSLYLGKGLSCSTADANLSLGINRGKSELTILGIYQFRNYSRVSTTSNDTYIFDPIGEINRNETSHNSSLRADYFYISSNYTHHFKPNSFFSAELRFSHIGPNKLSRNYLLTQTIADKSSANIKRDNNTNTNTPTIDIYLRNHFNDKTSLDASVAGFITNNNNSDCRHYHWNEDGHEETISSSVKNKQYSLLTEVLISHIFSQKHKLDCGLRNTVNSVNNIYAESIQINSSIKTNEIYPYAQISGKFKDLSYLMASGQKFYHISENSFRHNYSNNVSNLFLSYPILKKGSLSLKAIYQKRSPQLSDVDDAMRYVDDLNIIVGNPFLKPTESIHTSLNFNYNHNLFFHDFSLSFPHQWHPIIPTYYQLDGHIAQQMSNANYSQHYQATYNFRVNDVFNHFGAQAQIIWVKTHLKINEIQNRNLCQFVFGGSLSYNAGSFMADISYRSKQKSIYGYSILESGSSVDMSIKYAWNDFVFRITGSSLFSKKGSYFSNELASKAKKSFSSSSIKDNANWITLSISYRLNFGHQSLRHIQKKLGDPNITEKSAILIQ